jgi:hypothetical protein
MNGVWSHADMKRGRVILIALGGVIVAKEAAVVAFAYLRGLIIDPNWLPATGSWFAAHKGWLLLAIKATGLFFAYRRQPGMRILLGLIYLLTGGLAVSGALHPDMAWSALPLATGLTIGNGALGLIIGLLLWFFPPLRAFESAHAPGRVIVPIVPVEAKGEGFPGARRAGAYLTRLAALLPGLGLLGALVYFMNWHVLLRQWLAPVLGH